MSVIFLRPLLVVALIMGVSTGCSSSGSTYTDPDPENTFANSIKNQFVAGLTLAKRSKRDATEQIPILVETFDEGTDPSEAGEHRETVEKLRDGAKELQAALQGSKSQSEINAKIDALLKLANTLPGDVQPFTDAMEGEVEGNE